MCTTLQMHSEGRTGSPSRHPPAAWSARTGGHCCGVQTREGLELAVLPHAPGGHAQACHGPGNQGKEWAEEKGGKKCVRECGGAKDNMLRGSKGPPSLHSSDLGRDGEWRNDGHVKSRAAKSIPGRGHPWHTGSDPCGEGVPCVYAGGIPKPGSRGSCQQRVA